MDHLPVDRVCQTCYMPCTTKRGISIVNAIGKMISLILPDTLAFREKANGGKNRNLKEQKTSAAILEELSDDDNIWLLCKQCSQKITKPAARISINGSHRHTFANPSGIIYEIGCFNQVRGCSGHGAPSSEFAWFAGFSWQIVVCGQCLTHLGWFFSSGRSSSFSGLILNRLVEESSKN